MSSAGGTSSRVEGPKPLGRHARNTHATHTHSLFLTHGILLFMIPLSLFLSISFSSRLPFLSSSEMLSRFQLFVTFFHGDYFRPSNFLSKNRDGGKSHVNEDLDERTQMYVQPWQLPPSNWHLLACWSSLSRPDGRLPVAVLCVTLLFVAIGEFRWLKK